MRTVKGKVKREQCEKATRLDVGFCVKISRFILRRIQFYLSFTYLSLHGAESGVLPPNRGEYPLLVDFMVKRNESLHLARFPAL